MVINLSSISQTGLTIDLAMEEPGLSYGPRLKAGYPRQGLKRSSVCSWDHLLEIHAGDLLQH